MLDAEDILNVDAYKALDQRLRVLGKTNIVEGVMRATKLAPGGEVVKRFLAASKGAGKLPMREFLYYQLWNPQIPAEDVPNFVSFKTRPQHYATCNDQTWWGPTQDKVIYDMILRAAGIPVPEMIAVFCCAKPAKGVKSLETPEDLRAFLRDPAHYPMIAKPNYGGRSLGILGLDALDGNTIHLRGGQKRDVDEVAAFLAAFTKEGYLFQRLLHSDPRMHSLTGGGLACCRVIVILTEDGPVAESFFLKIPRSDSVADNYWRGGMLAGIDDQTGEVVRVVSGSGFDMKVYDRHPETGAELPGMKLPGFDDLKNTTAEIARLWPKLTMQGWDMALTEAGPVPIEVNMTPGVNLQQLAHGRGALTPTYCAHLRAQGWKKPLPY